MKNKKVLTREELSALKVGIEEDPGFIPAPPPGYKYCDYWRTCPSFDWRVCIFPINDIDPNAVAKSCGS